ncbi:hypothetical protein B0F90DRAFT_1815219 [Multifurca ochricompacta]|uniref:Uncharacterized protein n=1 Tax=Multifurca ochricompacta TaxID=376703 RepID=A0AAD4QQY5_9AGAM|nr:hypothetical protein B0F90DRAFT_1815219 [Multifurca ochricompacta]
MEEYRPPRPDSGILIHHLGSTSSSINLPAHAASFGITDSVAADSLARATPAGVPVADGGDTRVPQPVTEPRVVPAVTPFYRKRSFIISQVIGALIGIGLLFVLLYPVVKAIGQHVVKNSNLNIDRVAIVQPSNASFSLHMDGWVSHAGIFSAQIGFTQPLRVSWLNGSEEVPLGHFNLAPLNSRKKRAYVNQTTDFSVTDQDAFGKFTQHMITSSNFTWRLRSDDLHVRALKFPLSKGLSFQKDVTLNGINNFESHVTLKEFQLPSDSPEGGINFYSVTTLTNPSPFQLNLGTVVFDIFYDNVYLGQGIGTNTSIAPGPNDIALTGRLVPHNGSEAELATVGQLFTQYINDDTSPLIVQGVSTLQNDNTSISWLSEGLQALRLNLPFKSPAPINTIRSINIDNLSLAFSEAQPWAPVANSHSVQALLHLPFGFNMEIGQIENAFNILRNGSIVAGLTTPLGASTSDVHVLNSTNTEGTINIVIEDTAFSVSDPSKPYFSAFNAELTDLDYEHFQLEGHARAVANLSVGTLTLDPIRFNVSSGLWGLRGLRGLVSIEGIDVLGGTQDALSLGTNVTIDNPSNLNIEMGNLVFQLLKGNSLLGTTLMPNLTLLVGNNSVQASTSFSPNDTPEGQEVLKEFLGKNDSHITISGYSGSTKIPSLLQAFETIDLNVTLPGLKSDLLSTAALTGELSPLPRHSRLKSRIVLPTTGRENNITHVSVALANPFTAPLLITGVRSNVSTYGIPLGTIGTATNFTSAGKSTVSSPSLDLDLNMDPPALFTVTRLCAIAAGLRTEQLDGIVQLGGYQYLPATNGGGSSTNQKRGNIYSGFNLPKFVDTAFKQLHSDVQLEADVQIGDYRTTLQYTQLAVPTKTDETLNLLLPILAQPIVQKIVAGSSLGVNSVLITNPTANSFGTKLSGSITQAGPFDAEISFGTGLTISWSGRPLGNFKMPNINITGDVGSQFEVEATFEIADVGHVTDFTKVLLTLESFDWVISGENLSVSALGITVSGISLPEKTVTLKGLNNLKNGVVIKSFDLPANDPAGGIHLRLDTTITNPSQVGIALSSIGFQNYFGSTNIGPVASDNSFTLAPLATSSLTLAGRLVPQTQESGLLDVSTIFNNFIHGLDTNVSVHGNSAGPGDVVWLNEGIKSLTVETVLPNQGKLDIIKSIGLNELDLRFTEGTAYGPATSSNDATAAFTLPFDFPVDIKALEPNISISTGGAPFAELVIPKGPATTDVQQRIIHLTFSNVPFALVGDQHGAFQQFLASTTTSTNQTMNLSGKANTDADTAVGLLSLTDIEFSVSTSIAGLQGLTAKPTLVMSLDVNQGFPDYLLIKVNSSLFNPSNITLGAGDVDFGLDQQIGTAVLSNLLLLPGNQTYPIDVHFQPRGGAVPASQVLLENYLQGVTSNTAIQGSQSSTAIDSLKIAMSDIRLSPVEIPALHQNLISSASLEMPANITRTGIASASFTLDNPFTASINLLELASTVTYQQLTLGKINHVDLSSSPVHANGHSIITSPQLPFEFNMDPLTIIQLLLSGAQNNRVDLGPLIQLFGIVAQNPNYHPPITTSVGTGEPACVSGKQFDVAGAILNSLKNLKVTLDIDSRVKIDEYATELVFKQSNVTAITDQTALYLIGAVAPPIVQTLVDGANLTFSAANITNLSDGGFDLALQGALTNVGPLDALIEFEEPVTGLASVTWQGHDVATISLPSICATANAGVPDYRTNAHLTITDEGQFTAFATFLLHNPSFTWTIHTNKLRVTALGTIFYGVSLSKDVAFKAFNGFPGVTISNFQLPSDDPAGGIHIETDSLIPSPAQLGIDLGTVGFQASFEGTVIGPLSTTSLSLAPESVTTAHLSGRITPKSGGDLDTVGTLFAQFLSGQNQTLSVQGDFVQPPGAAAVRWLSGAFKTLTLQVILPGHVYKIIESISLSDLEIVMTEQSQAFAPLTSSQHTLATYKNPFGFSLQVVRAAEDIILGAGGIDAAELKLPVSNTVGGVSTGNIADLEIAFSKQPLQSLNNLVFAAFFAAVTGTEGVQLDLKGSADVMARTTIGDVPISKIPFNVTSPLKGIDSFGHVAGLSNVSITGSGGNGDSQYINADLTTTLQNPSNISLQTNDISLAVFFKDVKIGHAAINTLNLAPGENTIATEFHYEPDNANDTTAQDFLTEFIQTGDSILLFIRGDSSSSPYPSLITALEGISLSASLRVYTLLSTTTFQGLNSPPIITHINVHVPLSAILDNLVSIDFDIANPLDTDMHISFAQADSGVNGETYAQFGQAFTSFTVPARGTANSGQFGNVLLTKGAIPSLAIIPLGRLDVFAVTTVTIGDGGYTIPWLHLTQLNVPTHYDLFGLSLVEFQQTLRNTTAEAPSSIKHNASSTQPSSSQLANSVNSVANVGTSDVGSVGVQVTSVGDSAMSGILKPRQTQAPAPTDIYTGSDS